MSEVDPTGIGASREEGRAPSFETLAGRIGDHARVEREGLPQGYRMRADAHYVDHLESRYEGHAIRLIAIDDISGAEPAAGGVDALARSIAIHGVLQPLLVRRQNGRYLLIAGRSRLAAATAAGLGAVPCLLYDADDAKAAALAEADNVHAAAVSATDGDAPAGTERLRDVLRAVSAELVPLQSSAALLYRTPVRSFQHRVAADLMVAQAWRASWLARATAAGLGDSAESRPTTLHRVFDIVRSGFEAEARVTALQLDFALASGAGAFALDEDVAVLALAGGIFATLAWLDGVENPRLEVRAEAPAPNAVKLEIVQRIAGRSAEALDALQDPCAIRSEDFMAAVGLQAMRALGSEDGGTFQVSPISGRGTLIQVTLKR